MEPRARDNGEETAEDTEMLKPETEFMKRIEACKSWDSVAAIADEVDRDLPSLTNTGVVPKETPADELKPVKKKPQLMVPPPVVPRRIGKASYSHGSFLPQPSRLDPVKNVPLNEERVIPATDHRYMKVLLDPTESSLGIQSRIPKIQNLGFNHGPLAPPNPNGDFDYHHVPQNIHQHLVSIFPYMQEPTRNAAPDWCPPGFAFFRHGHRTDGPDPFIRGRPPQTLKPLPDSQCLRQPSLPPEDNHPWNQNEKHGKTLSLPPLRRKPRIVETEHHNSDEECLPTRSQRHVRKPLIKMEVKLGSLGLDKDSEEYQARLEKVRKQRSYAAQVRARTLAAIQDKHQEHHNHHHHHQRSPKLSSDNNRCRPESASSHASRSTCRSVLSKSNLRHPMVVGNHPGLTETDRAAARRAKMKEYAAQIKRPTSFLIPLTNPRINNAHSKGQNTSQISQSQKHQNSKMEHHSDDLRLSEMEKEHEKGMEDVRRIRRELGL